jgi:hypothetical protein
MLRKKESLTVSIEIHKGAIFDRLKINIFFFKRFVVMASNEVSSVREVIVSAEERL